MQWWCSATGFPWTWTWQWYPGVHLFLILLAAGWWWLGRVQRWSERPWPWFALASLLLLLALDWPLGKLGAGYLASAHTIDFLLLTLGAGPALIKSFPAAQWDESAPRGSRRRRVLHFMARPLPGLLAYTAIVITTHFPTVVDTAMTSQLGSMGIDLLWIVAGCCLWWPIIAPGDLHALGVWGTIGYIFAATIGPTIPAAMMIFSDWPIYQLYEQAPRVWVHFTANDDIELAGLIMKVIGDIPLWITALVVFYRGTNTLGEMVDA